MALRKEKLREIIFQVLYSYSFTKAEEKELMGMIMKHHLVTRKNWKIAWEKALAISEKQKEIDQWIETTSQEYAFDRISLVEKTILRLAIYEILYDPSIDPKVSIAEAIRLACKFGSSSSSSFVNAVLDAVYKKQSS